MQGGPFDSSAIATVDEYDFGPAPHGPKIRSSTTTYQWQDATTGTNYLNAGLIDLPKSKVVTDGGGNQCAETDYTYDEPAYLTTFAGTASQHGLPPAGSLRTRH